MRVTMKWFPLLIALSCGANAAVADAAGEPQQVVVQDLFSLSWIIWVWILQSLIMVNIF